MSSNHFEPDPDDFVIVVMGPPGSGKTNFINKVTGNPEIHEPRVKSDAQDVTVYPTSYHGHRLVLVDMPGFHDNCRQTLRIIAQWITQRYPDGNILRITGIIYTHRITGPHMSGSVHENLQVFGRLCGDMSLPRTRLVTTMWDVAEEPVAIARETELKMDFWQELIGGGAIAHRFYNTHDSAWRIVCDLLHMEKDADGLLLQEELVEQGKYLNETEAGKVLYNRLQNLLAEQKRTLKELIEEVKLQCDPALAQNVQEECENAKLQLQRTFEEMKEMKIPLSRRIILWLFGRKSRARAIALG